MVKKRLLAFFLTLAMLLSLCPLSAFAAENDLDEDTIWVEHEGIGGIDDTLPLPSTFGTRPSVSYATSYYEQLDGDSKTVYDAIYSSSLKDGPVQYESNNSTTYASFNVACTSQEDASSIISSALAALVYDHPELSWLVNTSWSYGYQHDGSPSQNMIKITNFKLSNKGYREATLDPKNVGTPDNGNDIYDYADTKGRNEIETAINNAKSSIGDISSKSDYEKVKTLYDWVCNNMEYAHYREGTSGYNADEAAKFNNGWRGYQTAYSALVEKVTVCAGYAKSFKLLCDEYNIPCAIIRGTSHDENHAWNYVQVGEGTNKNWYAIDCTWADQSTYIDYNYLLKGSTSFTDHTETALSAYAGFAYPQLSTGDYTDPNAPDSIELTYDTSDEQTSGSEKKYFKVPTVSELGTPVTKEITFTAKPMKDNAALSDQIVEWVLSAGADGVTLRTNSDGTATLVISNSANADYNPNTGYIGGYSVTVTAMCGTTSESRAIAIWGDHKTVGFVQIPEESKTLSPNGTATYTAKVYDQYGIEIRADRKVTNGTHDSNNKLVYTNMTVPEITWTVTPVNTGVSVANGTVTVAQDATAGDYTVTATAGNASTSVTITVSETTPTVITLTDENTTITLDNEADLTYTGAAIAPKVTVIADGKTLTEDTDYTVSYSKNIGAGTDASVTVTGIGNYTGTPTKSFTIKKADTTVTATANPASITVDGTTAVNATVKRGETVLTSPAVTYTSSNPSIATVDGSGKVTGKTAGTATITVKYAGDDNHNPSETAVTITVTAKTPLTVTVSSPVSKTYGDAAFNLNATTNGGTLSYAVTTGTDVVAVDGTGNVTIKKAGSATITVTATPAAADTAHDKGTATVTVTVNPKTVTGTVTVEPNSYVYTGSAITPTKVTVTDGTTEIPSSEYRVTYDKNINVGNAKVNIVDNEGGNYTVSGEGSFAITKATPTVTAPTAKTLTYSGSAQELVNAGSTTGGTLQYRLGDTGTYGAAVPTATNAGTYTVYYKVVGGTNYNDVAEASVTATINKATLTIKAKDQAITYGGSIATGTNQVEATRLVSGDSLDSITLTANGTTITPSVAVVKKNGTDLTDNYSITYQDGTLTFNAKSISDATIEAIANQTYTGSTITPTVTVKDGNKTLTKDTDYTVAYSNNINAGTATMTVTGQGNYTGTTTAMFTITAKAITSAVVTLEKDSYTYTGTNINPAVKSVTLDGKTLAAGTDYTVSYSDQNVNVGTGHVEVSGAGNYSDMVEKTFTIIKANQTPLTISGNTTGVVYGDRVSLTASGGTGDGAVTWSVTNGSATVNDGAVTITGTGSITVKAVKAGGSNYNDVESNVTFTAGKKTLTVSGATVAGRQYDGTTAVTVTAVTLDGVINSDDISATANGTIGGSNAGTYTSVTLSNLALTGDKAANYVLTNPDGVTVSGVNVVISKAGALTPIEGDLPVVNGLAHTYTYGLGSLRPAAPTNQSYGADVVTYTLGTISLGNYYATGASVSGTELTLPIQAVDGGEPADIGTITVTIHSQNYADMTATIKVRSVNKKMPTGTPTLSATTLTYGQPLSTITLSGSMTDGETEVPGTFAWSSPDIHPTAQEGYSAAWQFTPNDNENYAIVTGTAAIKVNKADQAALTTSGKPSGIVYGDTFALTASGGDGDGAVTWSVTSGPATVAADTGRVTITGTGAVEIIATKAGNTNYNEATATVAFTAEKKSLTVTGAAATARTYDGTAAVAVTAVNISGIVNNDDVSVDVSGLSGTISSANAGTYTSVVLPALTLIGAKAGYYTISSGTVPANVTIEKAAPAVEAPSGLEITAGQALSTVTLPNGWAWDDPTATVSEAGAFPATYTPADTANYNVVKQNLNVTVKAVTPGHTHDWATAWSSDSTHHWHNCTASDCPVAANSEKDGYAAHTPGDWITDTAATSTTAGSRHKECTVCGYITVTESIPATGTSGTPSTPSTPSAPSTPSMPSIPSTPTAPPVTTGTTTADGTPITETSAKPTATITGGTATTTVSSNVGGEIVKQAEKNNSSNVVIAPEIKEDVTKTEVTIPAATVGEIGSKTKANLTVSTPVADVTIPNEALSDLSKSGGSVKITAEQTENTVELSVKAGSKTVDSIPGGMKVTVPVYKPTPGTVAVLVHEDGTWQVIRKSVAKENGVTIPLDGSAKIEIVDNSKQFNDVPATDWAASAVAFASSHELFNGTSSTTFSPDQSMSRGMLAVVLHNMEGNPAQVLTGMFSDVDNSKWYAEGISWAAAKGIITGYSSDKFGPNDDITREQLAVMLWRYAGSPSATSSNLNFADADKISSWALEAMRWATENGIINGKNNGILDPTGKATRAQAAQMLKNFMEM